MRLDSPSLGDTSDRLSILALKILFGEMEGKETAHFKSEQAALLAKIRSRTLNGSWFGVYTELAAVNAALWHAEDNLREWRQGKLLHAFGATDLDQIRQIAFRIQELNDRRASCVAQINKDSGEANGAEKLNG